MIGLRLCVTCGTQHNEGRSLVVPESGGLFMQPNFVYSLCALPTNFLLISQTYRNFLIGIEEVAIVICIAVVLSSRPSSDNVTPPQRPAKPSFPILPTPPATPFHPATALEPEKSFKPGVGGHSQGPQGREGGWEKTPIVSACESCVRQNSGHHFQLGHMRSVGGGGGGRIIPTAPRCVHNLFT